MSCHLDCAARYRLLRDRLGSDLRAQKYRLRSGSAPVIARMTRIIEAKLESLVARVINHPELDALAASCGMSRSKTDHLLTTYCNEARIGLRLIAPLVNERVRILEIGAGLGILAQALADSAIRVTAIEPTGAGFEFMQRMSALVRSLGQSTTPVQWLEIGAEALNPGEHGTFDLIFSINALEHIQNLDNAFSRITSVLAASGQMVHLCPNYTVPYEPHFAIPLLPLFPRATRFLFRTRLKMYPGLWEELNFVTAGRVEWLARKCNLEVSFDPAVMGGSLRRFKDDSVYHERHRSIAMMQRIIEMAGLVSLVDRVPARFATPMVMRLKRKNRPTP